MTESRHVTLELGDVSLAPELGGYYIDMRRAMVHYTENIYGGGFDARGVPMVRGPEGLYHSPVNIAQYGFMLHSDWIDTGDAWYLEQLEQCIAVLDEARSDEGEATVWWHRTYEPKYDIEPPWASAMAQGEAISLYLRMHQALGDDALLDTALRAYRFLAVDQRDGGVRRYDDEGNLWLEEYPSAEPSFVLNGFVYAVLGLYDLYRVTRDPAVKADIDRCVATLVRNVHRFDAGYWSLYDLQRRELVRAYYQKNVHVPQMAILHQLTGEEIFETYRVRWERQLTPLNLLLVQLMYRVKPRWDRGRRRWDGRRTR